jgi:hypothetical protein
LTIGAALGREIYPDTEVAKVPRRCAQSEIRGRTRWNGRQGF